MNASTVPFSTRLQVDVAQALEDACAYKPGMTVYPGKRPATKVDIVNKALRRYLKMKGAE